MDQNHGKKGKDGSLKDLWLGIGISIGIYLVGLLMLFVNSFFLVPYLPIAALALIVIPLIAFLRGRKRLSQGALIGLGLNILLFSACFGIIMR